jgi:predicted amidohydrolase
VDSEAGEILEQIPGEAETCILRGGSAIIGPDASYVVEPVLEEARILYAQLELGRVVEGHLTLDTDGHYARPDVFHLEVNDEPQPRLTFRSQAHGNDVDGVDT